MGSTVTRAISAVATSGVSEVARKKPFQPGGGGGNLVAAALGPGGAALDEGLKAVNKPPSLPEPTAAPTVADKAAQEAVAESARRRSRARGFRSTILSDLMPSSRRETFGG